MVANMKRMSFNPFFKRVIVVVLLIMPTALVAWFSFRQGERHIAEPLMVRMLNDDCFDSWAGLTALKDTNQANLAILLDREMDYSAAMLAAMSLQHPDLVRRGNYNLLLRVRDYRKKYGREAEGHSDYNTAEVDQKIAKAIAYLESIHDTNRWGVPTLEEMIDQAEKSKRGK